MASRYVRDEIISQALDLAASPTVTAHDMPGGVVQPNAYAIKWLQNALDKFHRKYPFSSDIQDVTLTLQANNVDVVVTSDTTLYLPTDFIIDVRNGLEASYNGSSYRLTRKSYQYWLNYKLGNQNTTATRALVYTIINNRIKVLPLLSTAQSATLHYYALATALDANDPVNFPDEWTLIEFVSLKAKEWTRSIEVGTAEIYLTKQLAGLRSSGLLNEPEYEDGIPLENNQSFNESSLINRNSWMGNYAI